MRIITSLLLSAVLLAACSDNSETTAPRSRLNNATSSSAVQSEYPPGPTASGKPVDQVGWTKVTSVWSTVASPGFTNAAQTANCPAGTTLISGGYAFTSTGNPDAPPLVRWSHGIGNQWYVSVANQATGAGSVAFQVYALCAS